MRLSAQQLAQMAGADLEAVERLVGHDLIRPGPDGRFTPSEAHLARRILAYERAGIGLDVLTEGVTTSEMRLRFAARFYPEPSPHPGRPYSELLEDLVGYDVDLGEVYTQLGLAEPDPKSRIDPEEQEVVWGLLDVVGRLPDRPLVDRALSAYALSARRTAETVVALYGEFVSGSRPFDEMTPDEAFDRLLEPWAELSHLAPRLIAWLHRRHLENVIDSYSVTQTEAFLAEQGLLPELPERHPAIVFVDVAGYTRLSEMQGDRVSAALGGSIADLSTQVARGHGGQVVKFLGDGAMLHFVEPTEALRFAVELRDLAGRSGLPPLHVGIDRGPVVYRDGDYYGRTVNTAARISDAAPGGEVYTTDRLAAAAVEAGFGLRPVGRLRLHGITQPVHVSALEV